MHVPRYFPHVILLPRFGSANLMPQYLQAPCAGRVGSSQRVCVGGRRVFLMVVPSDFSFAGPIAPRPQGRRGDGDPRGLQEPRGQGRDLLPPQVRHPHRAYHHVAGQR